MATLSYPQYPQISVNMPEVHEFVGRFSAIASPVILAGKGFSVARQGTGSWTVTLNRAFPAGRILAILVNTIATVDEDITPYARLIDDQNIRFVTRTGATATDPNANTQISFSIKGMLKKLPVI